MDQLKEYYKINKAQARNSSRLSALAIILGLATVLVGIWIFYADRDDDILAGATTAAGAIAQFIGAGYFWLLNKATHQLNLFYANLVRSQETMLAVFLTDNLEGEARVLARRQVVETLLNRRPAITPVEGGQS